MYTSALKRSTLPTEPTELAVFMQIKCVTGQNYVTDI